jgi:hypothetical protein
MNLDRTSSPHYWFCQIMNATSRADRRRILHEQVPVHLRELVEYTVQDVFNKMKFQPKTVESNHEA